ncbi:MAG: SufD family Fe-S cluster assembly protein [Opitutales bacterium]|nr:SufD family Fe-S cluster assembly protein [Opitutales bacterium]
MRLDKVPIELLTPGQSQPFGIWEQPNRFCFHESIDPEMWFAFAPREASNPLFVHIGKQARVKLIEQLGGVYYHVHEQASLFHVQTFHATTLVMELDSHAQIQHALYGTLSSDCEITTRVHLNATGASIDWNEGISIEGNHTYRTTMALHHRAPQTRSHCCLRTVIWETGTLQGIYEGYVEETASQSVLHQQNTNYILHPKGHACMLPHMWIAHKNVEASHGTATEPFPEEAIFYLQSRGFSAQDAQKTYLQSFLQAPFAGYSEFPLETLEAKPEICPPVATSSR